MPALAFWLQARAATILRKSKGAKGAKAPKLNFSKVAWRNAGYTWLGVFLTVLALSGVNQAREVTAPLLRFAPP